MNRLHKIAVIGAGSWGTALSMVLATRECEVVLWTPEEAQARQLAETRRSPVLSKTALPLAPNIHPTCDLGQVKDAELIVVVVPSVAMRSVAQRLRSLPVQPDAVIVSCTKGIEQGTHKRMTEILQEYLPSNPIGVLSGPNHAEDICLGLPSASLIGFEDPKYADWVQQIFASKTFRVYSATDIIGMQLGGTIKNVFAIGAGLCEGLNLGDNAQAALLTRGLAEMTRIGVQGNLHGPFRSRRFDCYLLFPPLPQPDGGAETGGREEPPGNPGYPGHGGGRGAQHAVRL